MLTLLTSDQCIQQDDAEDKHRQIRQMDSIYISAELTLIAAAGDDPSFGLPGVSKNRKMRHRDATVGDMRVSYVPPTVHSAITYSRWFTRGWTFQEGYLARRRLYFTDSAVLFVCNQSQEYEGFQRCAHESDAYLLSGTLNSQAIRATSASGVTEVMRLIERYSARILSYDHDALNAIFGVLNYHHAMVPPINTLWGIPYLSKPVGKYIICINWARGGTATRRLGYPSWSPLGWDGSVLFTGVWQQFELSDKDAGNIFNRPRDGLESGDLEENSRYLQITVKIQRFRLVNIAPTLPPRTWDGNYAEYERPYLVIPIGGATGEHADTKLYLPLCWDASPSDDYDSAGLLCAVTYDTDLDGLSLMVLQDHNTHYERIGFAVVNSETYVMKGSEFSESTSTTQCIQSLRAYDIRDLYWTLLKGDRKDGLAWIHEIEPVTITLG